MTKTCSDALNYSKVRKCHECETLGKRHVPSFGTPAADLMIIGQSPGVTEVKKREPFCGESGDLIEGLLAELLLSKDEVYIANTIKCHPEGNRRGYLNEIKQCFTSWLKYEINEVNPKVLLLLGRDAWSITPKIWNPKHGRALRTKTTSFIYWYHPAYFLRRADIRGFLKVAELIKRELER